MAYDGTDLVLHFDGTMVDAAAAVVLLASLFCCGTWPAMLTYAAKDGRHAAHGRATMDANPAPRCSTSCHVPSHRDRDRDRDQDQRQSWGGCRLSHRNV